ncbi:uncharacterized protein LOC141601745 [Silene latifolia]|uniref:uncharacterized protein LOC141601745 n=1 Tax=Silene latifolia TaxID=37657 RepID=UPI003D7767D2
MRAFKTFSLASGLVMNQGKSEIYCNGVEEHVMAMMIRISGMHRGKIPFKYLGVNISPKRLGVNDCQCLIDKVTTRIRSLGARKLSYAGRLEVSLAWHRYQGESTLVAWEHICKPKKKGGLGLRNQIGGI